jgi:phosphate starvation-inducible protein PhoH and related proteins
MADALIDPVLFDQETEGHPVSIKAAKRKLRKAEKEVKQFRRTPKPIEPRNDNQRLYIDSLENNELTFAIGPAGVGKTYVPSRLFGQWLVSGKIEKLYIARPNVAKAKHRNGFLPGTLEEKTAPWLVPIFDGLKDAMGPAEFDKFRKEKKIEEVPFEFIQGRTLRPSEGSNKGVACIIDEAENLDLDDLYITLTRQGEDLTMVLCGDIYQARIHDSGLATVVKMAGRPDMESVDIIEFTEDDVTRSRQTRQWVKAFRAHWGHANLPKDADCDTNVIEIFRADPPQFLKETG